MALAVSHIETRAIGLEEGTSRGSFTYAVLPRSKPTVTVRINGHRRVIRPPLGVYVLHHSRGRHGSHTVILSPSWPHWHRRGHALA
jgi:hypothetical protein